MKGKKTLRRGQAWLLAFVMVLMSIPQTAVRALAEGRTSLAGAEITLSSDSFDYDGTKKMPDVSTVVLGGNTLEKNTDYHVSTYMNNMNAYEQTDGGAGQPTVVISGIGAYEGEANAYFKIMRRSFEANQASISVSVPGGAYASSDLPAKTYATDNDESGLTFYNGESQPEKFSEVLGEEGIVVKDGERTVDPLDYELSYWYHCTVSVSGTGGYTYTYDPFRIDYRLTGKRNYKDAITGHITLDSRSLMDDSVYVTFPKDFLYYQPEGYSLDGAGNTVKISDALPVVGIQVGENGAVEEVDTVENFDITFLENTPATITDVGKYTIILSPKNGTEAAHKFTGARPVSVRIKPIDFSKAADELPGAGNEEAEAAFLKYPVLAEWTVDAQKKTINYNASAAAPDTGDIHLEYTIYKSATEKLCQEVSVSNGGNAVYGVQENSFQNNINAGAAYVTVEAAAGQSNFIGTKQVGYVIKPIDLSGNSVTVESVGSYTYNGKVQKPSFHVVYVADEGDPSQNINLVEDRDYKVVCTEKDAGNAEAKIEGSLEASADKDDIIAGHKSSAENADGKNFYGTKTAAFSIAKNTEAFQNAQIKGRTSYPYRTSGYTADDLLGSLSLLTDLGNESEELGSGDFTQTGSIEYSADGLEAYTAALEIKTPGYYKITVQPSDSGAGKNYGGTKEIIIIVTTTNLGIDAKIFKLGNPVVLGNGGFTSKKVQETDKYIYTYPENNRYPTDDSECKVYPEAEVRIDENAGALVKDTDYDIDYGYAEGGARVGDFTATVTGKGSYQGTLSQKYTVKYELKQNAALFDISFAPEKVYTYTGEEIHPEVKIVHHKVTDGPSGDYTLEEGKDYELKYVNFKDVVASGEADENKKPAIYLKGMGNYITLDGEGKEDFIKLDHVPAYGIQPVQLSDVADRILMVDRDWSADKVLSALNAGDPELSVIGSYADLEESKLTEGLKEILEKYYANNARPFACDLEGKPVRAVKGVWLVNQDGSLTKVDVRDYTLSYFAADNSYWSKGGSATVTLQGKDDGINIQGGSTSLSRTYQVKRDIGRLLENNKLEAVVYVPDAQGNPAEPVYTGETVKAYISKIIDTGMDEQAEISINTDDFEISWPGLDESVPGPAYINATAEAAADAEKPYVRLTVKSDEISYMGFADIPYEIKPLDISKVIKEITLTGSRIYNGTEIEPQVAVKDMDDNEFSADNYQVTYDNNINAGTEAKVILEGTGNYTGISETEFTIEQADLSAAKVTVIVPDGKSVVYDGQPHCLSAVVTLDGGVVPAEEYELSYYYVNGTAVADEPTENPTDAGRILIRAKAVGSNYKGTASDTEQGAYYIEDVSMGNLDITWQPASFAYDGTEKKPAFTVKNGNLALTEGTEYSVAYENNINAGVASAKLTGKGNYSGVQEIQYAIGRADISECEVIVEDVKYTGEAQKPEVVVKRADNGIVLAAGKDYSEQLIYMNNRAVGKAQVGVIGIGNYGGMAVGSFSIVSDGQEPENPDTEPSSAPGPAASQAPDGAASQAPGGTASQAPGSAASQAPVPAMSENPDASEEPEDNTPSEEPDPSEEQGEYDIADESNVSISVANVATDDDGIAPAPQVTIVTADGSELEEDTDYVTEYTEDLGNNTGTVTITGIGDYYGTVTRNYMIATISIAEAVIKVDNVSYNGTDQTPPAEVSLGEGNVLAMGVDYVLEYANSKNAGTATVTATGIGRYKGKAAQNFTVMPIPFEVLNPVITLADDDNIYNGKAKKPEVTVNAGTGPALTVGTDYTVKYTSNVNIGTATFTVLGMGNYAGSVVGHFAIKAPAKGYKKTVLSITYRIIDSESAHVEVAGTTKKGKLTVPASTRIGGKTYTVTAIGEKAFKNNKKLTEVKVGSNVSVIGKEAFSGAKKIKKVTLNGNVVKKVEKNAFKGMKKKCKLTIMARNKTLYKKLLKKIKASKPGKVNYAYVKKK